MKLITSQISAAIRAVDDNIQCQKITIDRGAEVKRILLTNDGKIDAETREWLALICAPVSPLAPPSDGSCTPYPFIAFMGEGKGDFFVGRQVSCLYELSLSLLPSTTTTTTTTHDVRTIL